MSLYKIEKNKLLFLTKRLNYNLENLLEKHTTTHLHTHND
jgi:hypothetical protein